MRTVPRSSPSLLRKGSDEEIAEYDIGFQAGSNAEEADDAKSEAWQRGWAEPQEEKILNIRNFSSRRDWCEVPGRTANYFVGGGG